VSETFATINDFLNYIDRCPVCNSRLVMDPGTTGNIRPINKNKPVIDDYVRGSTFVDAICRKYHFFYQGKIEKLNDKILYITLNKLHLIRQFNDTHFAINVNYYNDETRIRITDNNYNTSEVCCPVVDLTTKKKNKIDIMIQKMIMLA
jgi:hypothetical protein